MGDASRGDGCRFTRRRTMCNGDGLRVGEGVGRCLWLEVVKDKLITNFIDLESGHGDMRA